MTNKSLGVLQIFSEGDHILDKSVFPLHAGDNYIGSGHFCDILIPDSDIEAMAFKIFISEDGGDYGIEDIGSKLGLYKSGNDNTRQKLKPNKEYEFSSDKPIFIGNRYKCLLITKAFVKKSNEKIESSPAVDESQNSQALSQNEYPSKDHLDADNFQTQPLATLQQEMNELDNYHNGTPKAEKKDPLRPLVTASDFKNSLHDDLFDDNEEVSTSQSQKRNGAKAQTEVVKTEQATLPTTKSFKVKASLEAEKPETSSTKLKKGNSFNKKQDSMEVEKPESKLKKGNSIISKKEEPEPEEKPSKKEEKKKSKIVQPEPKESKVQSPPPPEKEPKSSLLALMGKNKLQDAQSDEEAAGTIEKAFEEENSNFSSSRTRNTSAKREEQDTSFTTKSFKKKGKEPEEIMKGLVDRYLSDQDEDKLSNDGDAQFSMPIISQDLRKKPAAAAAGSKNSQDVIKKNLPKKVQEDDEEEEEEDNSLTLFSKRRPTRRGTNEEAELDKKMKKEDRTPTRAKPKEEEKIMEITTTKDEDDGKRRRGRKPKAESSFLELDDLDGMPLTKSKSKDAKGPKKSKRKATDEMEIEDKKGKSKKKNYDTDEADEESDQDNRRKSKRAPKKKAVDDDFEEEEEEKPKKRGRKRKDSMEVETKEESKTKRKNKKEEKIDPLMTRLLKMSGEIEKNFNVNSESEDDIRLVKAKDKHAPSSRGRKAKNTKKEEESDDEPRRKKEVKATKATKKEEPEPKKSKIAEKQDKKAKNKPKQVVSEDEESEEEEEEPKPMEIEQTKSKTKKSAKPAEKPEPKKRGRPSSVQKNEETEEVVEKKLKTEKPKPAAVQRATPVRSSRRAKKDDDTSDIDVNLTKRNAYKVMFSGFDPTEDGKKLEDAKRKLKSIGVKVTDDKDNFNVLILGRYIRSVKFLLAVSRGISIVSLDWVFDCAADGKALPPDDYLVDDDTTKANFDFPLSKTLEKVRKSDKDLLKDYTVWMPNNIKPSYDDLKTLIESMKGTVIKTKPSKFKDDTLIILNEGDEKQASQFIDLGFKTYTTELIYSGILHQKLKLNQNLVK